jgi:hypothetical protein
MGGIDRTSRNIKRLRGVPDTFQVRKHFIEAQPDQPRNILSNNPSGPEFRHNSEHFRPEMAVILLASLLPGDTERLAGEPSANKVNCGEAGGTGFGHFRWVGKSYSFPFNDRPDCPFQSRDCGVGINPVYFPDIRIPPDVRPMFLKNLQAKRVDLDLPRWNHSGAFKAEVETSYASE